MRCIILKPTIGITLGDPAGIGPEIIVKALASADIYEQCIPVIIGDRYSLEHACTYCAIPLELRQVSNPAECQGRPGVLEYLEPGALHKDDIQLGTVDAACGEAAFQSIVKAISLAKENAIDAVVTAPINKEALNLAGHHFAGHTEIFAHYTGTEQGKFAMMLASGNLRVIHATTHVSMRNACDLITKERVLFTIRLAWEAAQLMGIDQPSLGVAGLNPHASENGLFGDEEKTSIIPAIEAAKAEGMNVEGPIPPDTVFVKALGGAYDIVVAMYHDQGHIPLKLHGFRMDPNTGQFTAVSGINTTIGLPIIRTSVDHGTAFDRAGKNVANPQSMIDAIELAVIMAKKRLQKRNGGNR